MIVLHSLYLPSHHRGRTMTWHHHHRYTNQQQEHTHIFAKYIHNTYTHKQIRNITAKILIIIIIVIIWHDIHMHNNTIYYIVVDVIEHNSSNGIIME
jgi:hypothetical protein